MKIFTLLLVIFLTACSLATLSTAPDPEKIKDAGSASAPTVAAPMDTYLIQPGDVLDIEVWKEKDLQREITVRPDGGLNFPLVGDIDVTDKTTTQLQKEIATKLEKFVPDPVVTVSVKQSVGNVIYVVGKVNKPGNYVVVRDTDVMQVLSMAGGLTPYASENNIKILRREHGTLKSIPFKYSQVEKGVNLEQNIILQGGDVVVVP